MSESSVVLPHPDGPTIDTNSQGPICRETSFRAVTCISSPWPNSRDTESIRSPTAWPRRSVNSSAGAASVTGSRTAGGSAGSWPLTSTGGGAGAASAEAMAATAVARAPRSSLIASTGSTGGLGSFGRVARLRWRRLPPEERPPRSSTAVATPKQSLSAYLTGGAGLTAGFCDLLREPFQVPGQAIVDVDLDDLRQLVGVVLADIFLDRLGARFDGLDEQQRLVLALELAVPVIEGMDHGDDGAASGQVLDHQTLAKTLRIVTAAGSHHDHHGPVS